MSKKRSKRVPQLTVSVFGEIFQYRSVVIEDPSSLDLLSYPSISDLHERETARRLAEAAQRSDRRFEVAAIQGPPSLGEYRSHYEEEADEQIEYIAAPIISGNLVLHHHDLVLRAIEEKKEIAVFQLVQELPPRLIFPFQARYAYREGKIVGPARMEVALKLIKECGLTPKQIQVLFARPDGRNRWSERSIRNQVRVGEIFDKWVGEPIGRANQGPSAHNFSALLRFVEIPKIRRKMDESPEAEKRFVGHAIHAAESGLGRVHDNLADIVRFPDTFDVFDRQGLGPARATLRANHPEIAADAFPLTDMKSMMGKMQNPEVQRILGDQASRRTPLSQEVISIGTQFIAIMAAAHPTYGRRLAEAVGGANLEAVVEWVATNAKDELLGYLSAQGTTAERLLKMSQ